MSELLSPLQAMRMLPAIIAKRPCVFQAADCRLLPLSETELWQFLDEIAAWKARGQQGELSEQAAIVYTAANHTAKCWEVFEMWQLSVKATVC
jgi:hypothetical protein